MATSAGRWSVWSRAAIDLPRPVRAPAERPNLWTKLGAGGQSHLCALVDGAHCTDARTSRCSKSGRTVSGMCEVVDRLPGCLVFCAIFSENNQTILTALHCGPVASVEDVEPSAWLGSTPGCSRVNG